MIQVLASGKGEGKTKRLIEMANNAVKDAHGRVMFIDDDSRHIYDLHYDIRFIDTTDFPMKRKSTFIGFLFGAIAQDRDVEQIFIDGLTNVVTDLNDDDLESLFEQMEGISKKHGVHFIISMNRKSDDLPEILRQYSVA